MHLLEKTGILSRTTEAKEKTEMAEIKERAEMKKLELTTDAFTGTNSEALKKSTLVSAINEEFEGSTVSGSTITTADGKYDIVVDNNLNITVVKHGEITRNITLAYQTYTTESRAAILEVTPTIEGAPTYEEFAQSVLDELPTDETARKEELYKIFIEGDIYKYPEDYDGIENVTGTDVADSWGYDTMDELWEEESITEEWLITEKYVKPAEYDEKCAMDITINCSNGESETINTGLQSNQRSAEFGITLNGNYTVTATNSDAKIEVSVTDCKEEKYSSIYTENTEMTIEGYKVTIPAGFAVGTSDNVGKVSTGLVITDSVDSEGNSTGNEFVWIPVQEDLTVGNTGKLIATLQDGSTTNYRGVLYNWDSDQTGNTTYYWWSTSTSYREPAAINYNTGYTGGKIAYDTEKGITTESLQNEYNTMIASVKDYGGFYVSRYEMSVENGKAISKIGKTPTSAQDEETKTWYGLYSMAETYTNTRNSVQSNMIWGSQYDAMLNFALASGNDKNKVHSIEYGNYSGTLLKTGLTKTSDAINNVYDLAGNSLEWTLEANEDHERVRRGGYFRGNGAEPNGCTPPSSSDVISPCYTYNIDSSRFSLYVR